MPAFLALDAKRRELLPHVETMRARQNAVSKAVPSMTGEDKQRAIASTSSTTRAPAGGSSPIPDVLRPYMAGQERITGA